MSKGIARVTIVGNLTREPEIKNLPSGSPLCEMGVAVNTSRKQNGVWEDYASFYEVKVWGSQAEACAKYLSKGRQVAIDGRLEQRRWQAEDGSNRSQIVVIADTVMFIGGGKSDARDEYHDVDFGSDDDPSIPF